MSRYNPLMPAPSPAALDRLKAAAGEGGWSQDADRIAPKLVEWRGRWTGATPLLLLPRTVDEVSALIRICAAEGVAVTPQGGNTGLVAGQIPQGEVLLSLERMRAIRDVDAGGDVMVVEAGATVAAVHEAAAQAGRRFPLNLASEGSATVGGLISTNAGGTAVLRYGAMREQVLGIEAVLPDGLGAARPQAAAQGQHRLRPAGPDDRGGGHAGRRHRRRAEAQRPCSPPAPWPSWASRARRPPSTSWPAPRPRAAGRWRRSS